MKDEQAYLIYISESIADITEFTAEGHDAFMASKIIQTAVLYKLETLADAASYLSETTKAAHPEVDWSGIRGFRNRLAHGYMATNLNTVWNIVEKFLAPLKRAVDDALGTLDDNSR